MIRKIKISDSFVLILAFAFILDTSMLTMIFLLAAMVHEIGHIIMILISGAKIKKIHLSIFGGVISYAPEKNRFWEFMIAACGPFIGIICAIISSKMGYDTFAGANLILSMINLFPVMPLDGGRMIMQLLSEKIARFISVIFCIISMICAVYFTINGYGCSFLLFCSVLLAENTCKMRQNWIRLNKVVYRRSVNYAEK